MSALVVLVHALVHDDAAPVGIVGRLFLGMDETVTKDSLVFINMVRIIFPGIVSGILLSAVLAASMSTADSQLLSAASAFASDVYKPVFRKNKASEREMMWACRRVPWQCRHPPQSC